MSLGKSLYLFAYVSPPVEENCFSGGYKQALQIAVFSCLGSATGDTQELQGTELG